MTRFSRALTDLTVPTFAANPSTPDELCCASLRTQACSFPFQSWRNTSETKVSINFSNSVFDHSVHGLFFARLRPRPPTPTGRLRSRTSGGAAGVVSTKFLEYSRTGLCGHPVSMVWTEVSARSGIRDFRSDHSDAPDRNSGLCHFAGWSIDETVYRRLSLCNYLLPTTCSDPRKTENTKHHIN